MLGRSRDVARSGFFDLRTHRLQIVCCGNHREQQKQETAQHHSGRAYLPPSNPGTTGLPPQPQGRDSQEQPEQVECQFHWRAFKRRRLLDAGCSGRTSGLCLES